jgi:hypothetical protein
MDRLIAELRQLTFDMVSRLGEVTVEDMERFTDLRGSLVESIRRKLEQDGADPAPYRQEMAEILQADPLIMARMEELLDEARVGMYKTRVARKQANAYEPNYYMESAFFDRTN